MPAMRCTPLFWTFWALVSNTQHWAQPNSPIVQFVACRFLGNRGTPCYIIIVVVVRKVSRSNDDWSTVFLMRQHCADSVEWDERSTPYIVRAYMLRYQLLHYIQFKLSLNETQYKVISLFFGRFCFRIFSFHFCFVFVSEPLLDALHLQQAHTQLVGPLALSVSSVCVYVRSVLCVFCTIKIVFTLMMACGMWCLRFCEMVNASARAPHPTSLWTLILIMAMIILFCERQGDSIHTQPLAKESISHPSIQSVILAWLLATEMATATAMETTSSISLKQYFNIACKWLAENGSDEIPRCACECETDKGLFDKKEIVCACILSALFRMENVRRVGRWQMRCAHFFEFETHSRRFLCEFLSREPVALAIVKHEANVSLWI